MKRPFMHNWLPRQADCTVRVDGIGLVEGSCGGRVVLQETQSF